jgi:Rieske Fe-S protein
MSMDAPQRPRSTLRRRIIDGVLKGGVVALAGAVMYPIVRFSRPPKRKETMDANVLAATVGELHPNSGKVFRFGSRPRLLIMTPDGEYRAYSAVCPHLNCTVQYNDKRSQIWCACHNGYFDLTGKVISGPPPKGLEEFQVVIDEDEILVSRRPLDA